VKVLLVSSKYQPEYSGSGLRAHRTHVRLNQNYDVATEVIASGVEFTNSENYELDGLNVSRVLSSKLRKIHWALGKGPFRRLTNAAVFHHEARRVNKLLADKNYDLIHVFGYSPATVAAVTWARRNNVPLMLELVNVVLSPYQYLPGTRKFTNYDLNDKTVVVAISEQLEQISEKAGVKGNVWVRPNPVDTERFKPVDDEARNVAKKELFGLDSDVRTIVYVAKFLKRKNHSFLIDVLAKLPENYRLVLAGPPLPEIHSVPGLTESDLPTLQAIADKLGVGDRLVIRSGFVDFAKYLEAADLTCFPSEDEGMGTPLLESLAAKKPVIANLGEPSFRQYIKDGFNGFLRRLDPEKWAEAIIKTEQFSNDQKDEFSTDIRNRYSTGKIDEKFHSLMQRLIDAHTHEKIDVRQELRD
jgi:glycosyltransferase involved in cell wall biosynthesis